MVNTFNLIFIDVLASFTNIRLVEYMEMGFLTLWVLILLTPLRGIDRRDLSSCLMYTLFIAFAAIVLLFALPSVLIKDESTIQDQIVTICILSAIGLLRWNWGSRQKKKYSKLLK